MYLCKSHSTQCGSERACPSERAKKEISLSLSPVLPWSRCAASEIFFCVRLPSAFIYFCVLYFHESVCVYIIHLSLGFSARIPCISSASAAWFPLWNITRPTTTNGTRRHYILKGDTLHFIDLVHHTVCDWRTRQKVQRTQEVLKKFRHTKV